MMMMMTLNHQCGWFKIFESGH